MASAETITNSRDNLDWPEVCVNKAAANNDVSVLAVDLIESHLAGTAQQRPLKASELSDLAAQLIATLELASAGDAA